ncbi:MAG: DUF1631 domain-containing protein [Proteobacteria bacterium]|nr:DUF1631 domain-containing protein [Pseudomonadota bacterium]
MAQNNIGHSNLVNSCLLIFHSTLKAGLETAMDITLKDLFLKAENASSNQQETKLFAEYNNLKKSSTKLVNSLKSFTMGMPSEMTKHISNGAGEAEIALSIIAEEDLEISLAFTQLESVLDIKFTQFLFALEKRLKVLFASKNITKVNMPFGASSVCWILSQTMELSSADIATKSSLIDNLKKQLIEKLFTTYTKIDQQFVAAGILPNIQVEKKVRSKPNKNITPNTDSIEDSTDNNPSKANTSSTDLTGTNQQTGHHTSQQTVANNTFKQEPRHDAIDATTKKSAELVNSIFNLMNQSRSQDFNSASTSATNIENSIMDQTLDRLSKVASVAAGSTEIDKLKEMILDNVRNETGIYYPRLSTQQQNSLDVMGMFYDQVKNDTAIDGNVLSSLNAINIPLIRTAISDTTFFEHAEHPARKYIEKILYAAQKWHGTSVVTELHKYSANIASEYDGTNESFVSANDNLESFLRLTERRAKKAEEKWINAAKGKEKLDLSRHKVEVIVENISQTAVPEFVKNVIQYVIQDAMTLALLRHGEDSQEWHRNISTSETIAKMANPKTIRDLTPKQKVESLHHLDKTMDELGFSENDRSRTINNIKECAEAASNDTLEKDIELAEVATINKEKKNVKKAGSKRIEELRPLTDKEKHYLTKVKLMPYGSLFDFLINQQRDRIRRQLSWFSPVSNKALFVTILGKKPYEVSLNAIAIDLCRKNILIVKIKDSKYFETVLNNMFAKLKGFIK